MRKKHNLKQRMLKREKKLKFIRKVKKFTCLSTVALMVISIINSQILAYATSIKNNNQVLKTQVEYNEDYSKANIKFDVNSVDKEKYEITSITSDKDGKAIYDKNKVTEENKNNEVTYETIENGSYSFTVKYVEKKEKEVQAINENVKEAEPEMEENTVIEGTVENNKDSEKQQVEKQEEEKVSENTIVEGKKEEKIVVDISKIKTVENEVNTKDESEEIKEDSNVKVDTNKNDAVNSISEDENTVSDNNVEEISNENIDNKITSESGLGNEYIDLKDEFNLTGTKQLRDGTGFLRPIDNRYYSINENSVVLGNEDRKNWTRQTIVLTSKYSVDFNRSFKIKGRASLSSSPEGFAIGFHNDKDYISKNTGGSMGIYYSEDDGSTSLNPGLNRAVVVEVDNFENSTFGDNGQHSIGHHIAVNITGAKGEVINFARKNIGNDCFGKLIDFEVDWFGSENKLKFNFGGNIIEYTYAQDVANKLKSAPGYYSIATGINYEYASGNNTIILDSFKYTDVDPKIEVYARIYDSGMTPDGYVDTDSIYSTAELKDRDLSKYLGTGQTLNIKLAFNNAKQSNGEFIDYFKLEKLQIGNRQLDIVQGSISFQESDGDVIAKPDLVFDRNNSIQIKYPANKGVFNVYMKVRLPDDLRLNINDYDPKVLPYLQLGFLLGQKGMSQQGISRNVAVATAPITEGFTWALDVGSSPAESPSAGTDFDKEKLARVQLYDEIVTGEKRSLSIAIKEGTVDLKHLQHYYFDDNKDMFVPITPEEFVNSSQTTKGETGLYAYEFSVSDKRRSKVTDTELVSNKAVGRYTLNANEKGSGKNSFILTNANEITLSETEISTIGNTEDFKNYLIKKLSIKGYEDNGDLNVKKANIDIDFKNLDIANPKPGNYPVTVNAFNADKSSYSNKNITIKVTEIDASGYIVIPKYVNMESGSGVDKDKLVAESEIFFANYPSATNVSYGVSVEKQFNLIKTDDSSSIVPVTSASNSGQDVGNNKLYIGIINNQNTKGNGLNVKFTAPREVVDRSKGKWSGNVTFYFERSN